MNNVSSEAILIAKNINTFLHDYVPSQKSKSANTLRSYYYALTLYIGFLEDKKGITPSRLDAECFNQSTIEEWLVWLSNERNCSPSTCNNRLASIRTFLKYLGSREVSMLYLYETASRIDRRKEIRKPVKGMSKKAVKALLSVPDLKTKTGKRDFMIILLIYSSAARIDEILSLKIKHIFLNTPKSYITLIGKGSKIRTMYLLPRVIAHLKKYLKELKLKESDSDAYLFYSRNTGPHGKLSQSAISKRLRLHAIEAHKICEEVPLDLHAHQLRHAKASHWLDDGMNIVQISFLLGHSNLQTTMVYLDITLEEERTALATLEDDTDKKIKKKWKNDKSDLSSLCGLSKMKR